RCPTPSSPAWPAPRPRSRARSWPATASSARPSSCCVIGPRWARSSERPYHARVPLTDRLLLGPGPSNPYPEAVAALTRPMLGHLAPEFLALLDETMERLRSVFLTKNALTLPISGTGSAGMEACFVNLLEPGDTAVVGVNGVFGERMADVARRCGAEVVRVEQAWGRALEPPQLVDAQ